MAKVKITTKFDRFKLSTTNTNFRTTASKAKLFAQQSIKNGDKSGKKYASLINTSSAPGEAPANQTGALASSIFYRTSFGSKFKSFSLGAKVPYAARLEYGGFGIAERPFLRPAINKALINYANKGFRTEEFITSS